MQTTPQQYRHDQPGCPPDQGAEPGTLMRPDEPEQGATRTPRAPLKINTYKYEVIGLNGRRQKGHVRAMSEQQAAAILAETGVELRKLTKESEFLKFQIGARKIKRAELIVFTRQLATFVDAGISLIDAFTSIGSESASVNLQDTLREMAVDLARGLPVSEAMGKHKNVFPSFYIDMVRAGEITGDLSKVLENVADYLERRETSKKAVRSALIYPSIIAILTIVTVVVMVTFVLPRFRGFFASLNAKLPATTRFLMGMSVFFQNYWTYMLLGLVAVAVALFFVFRSDAGKRARDRFFLQIPIVGDLITFAIVERFCATMSTMVDAGVPLATSFSIVIDITGNHVFKTGLASVQEAMFQGYGMSRPLAQTALFPPIVPQMIRVGEDVGQLDKQLSAASRYFGRELDHKLKAFTALFEPMMIVFMATCVGFVALALVQAMYGIYNQIGH